jgi:hypothetical protein
VLIPLAATPTHISSYPWQPESSKTGKRAIGDIGVGLMSSLRSSRGIHSETLLVVTGALAGFAAQHAALSLVTSGTRSAATHRSLAVVSTKPGEIFLYGDAINVYIFPESGSVLPLAAIIAGAAINAGVKEVDLPNNGEIAAHVARAVGSAEFGKLRARPGVAPQLEPLAALIRFWPQTREVLARPPAKPLFRRQESLLQEIHWPIVLGLVASQYIAMTKHTLNPSIGAALVMESAVMASKINPELVEPGKWRIDTGNTQQPITRLRS